MDLSSIASYTLIGLTFGLAGGLSPGPLTALVIGQTVRFGRTEGFKVALAPVITDGPLLLIAMFLLGELRDICMFTGCISILGCLVLIWLAIDSFRAGAIEVAQPAKAAGSISKAVLTNLANPHPYVFWFTIGAPTALKALDGQLVNAKKPLPIDPELTKLRNHLAAMEKVPRADPLHDRLRYDLELSTKQLSQRRLTGAQDLAWALINTPAFLFNR